MLYPFRRQASGANNTSRRDLDFHYGLASGSPIQKVNHAASRLSRIADSVLGSQLAEFEYAGSMRRVAFNRGYNATLGAFAAAMAFPAMADPAVGYEGLDQFGRLSELAYYAGPAGGPGPGSTALHSYEYAYDLADQPIWKEVTQRNYASQTHANTRSWLYGYDALHRLAAADMGVLSGHTGSTPNPAIGGSTLHASPRLEDWSLDPLGNWGARTISPIPGDSSGTHTTEHDTDLRNELSAVELATAGGSSGTTSVTNPIDYDAAGNLVLDDAYWYQYDGFGRLVKVSERDDLVLDSTGRHVTGSEGAWIVHYTYDALGRLARLQRPLPGYPNDNHVEHYYYDGVRRIQEVHRGLTILSAPGDGDEASGEDEASAPVIATWAEREYIHTADPGSYVDEFVCEVGNLNTSQVPLFHLQDANYNVLGLVAASGAVVRQYTLDPYGQLLHREDFTSTFESRLGHQGLFFTRLDAPQGDPDLTFNTIVPGTTSVAPLTTPVTGVYFTPNRTYSPRLGRWMQRDPNGTGSLILEQGHGPEAWSPVGSLSRPGDGVFTDGCNLTAYIGSAPTHRNDPSGLFFNLPSLMFGTFGELAESRVETYIQEQGDIATGRLGAMFDNYSVNMLIDAEWAEDWSADDSWGTRLGTDERAYYGSAFGGGGSDGLAMAKALQAPGEWDPAVRTARHGGALHDLRCRAWSAQLHAHGFVNIQFNRANGGIRPDVVVQDPKTGRWVVIEVENTSSYTRDELRARRERVRKSLNVPQGQMHVYQYNVRDPVPNARGIRQLVRPGNGMTPGRTRRR